jgi:N-acetylglucosamine repressor
MKSISTGNSKFLKDYNQKMVLDLIRTHKTLSRAKLSRLTGLTPTCIGLIAGSLLELGYIHETVVGESTGGRKPILLELKPGSFFSIGIDLDVNYIHSILMDTTGKVVSEKNIKFKKIPTFEEFSERAGQLVSLIIEENAILDKNLLGVGFSIPGIVNSETGDILLAPNLGWKNVKIKTHFKTCSNIPLYVENESMASAICESWIGKCQGIDHFVCINIESGVGAGIYTDGKPYKGATGSAGEIGHLVVDEAGPKCGCGNFGCLETLASTSGVIEQARKMVRQGVSSTLNQFSDPLEIEFDNVVEAAHKGDDFSRNIILESARYLGIAIANLVNIFNPAKVVIGKEFVTYSDIALDHIKGVVMKKALKIPAENVEIVPSKIGERASTLGAAIIPLKVLFGRD